MDRKNIGKVWLIGAGPGDAGLLTVKGREVLEQAEVVVYDALISLEILCLIPSTAEVINVGKRASNHLVSQQEINQILLKKALEGRRVVRLKGGDPFVFGRGGEELELLAENGIPFEIVPGISSPIAVAAYAGIPVTHRDMVSSLHIVTGHPRKGGESRIDYKALVKTRGTLLFLMGVSVMEEICSNLIEAGMDPQMPAAVLERGTDAKQRRIISTVGNLTADSRNAKIHTPAIIMIGEVCGLADKFHWAEDRKLGTKQILVTRPANRASKMAEKLREQGAHVILLPAVETKPKEDTSEFVRNIEELIKCRKETWIGFTSPSGVDIFFELLAACRIDLRKLLRADSSLKFAVIGSATEKALAHYGIYADLVPKQFYGKDMGDELVRQIKKENNGKLDEAHRAEEAAVYLFRAQKGGNELTKALKEAEIAYKDVGIYDTVFVTDSPWRNRIIQALEDGRIDCVTFTSVSTVESFVEQMGDINYSLVPALCIGKKTAEAAEQYGMCAVMAEQPTMDSMIEKILKMHK